MYKAFLRIESAAIFLFLIALFLNFDLNWTTFLIFILAPDLFVLGYLKGPKFGAFVYNLAHNYAVPIIMVIIAMATDSVFAATLAAVWAMHIAADRAVGFGLKLPKGFKHTHLGK
jgi:hypothetical protein